MMQSTTPTTELEAVNAMLSVIGELPVVDLSLADTNADVKMALMLLRSATRALQVKGWQFNTDLDITLYRGPDSTIALPADVARCTKADAAFGQEDVSLSIRSQKLYNRTTNSFLWDRDLRCDLTRLLPFEALPEPARNYLSEKAGQRFQARSVGSTSLHQFTYEDLEDAKDTLQDFDLDAGRWNLLTGNAEVALTWGSR